MNDVFYDSEDIVAKIQHIQDLTTRNWYLGWQGESANYIQRVEAALAALPRQHRSAALALFANIIYLPRMLLDEAWREILLELQLRTEWRPAEGFRDALFLGVDDAGLVTKFSHIAMLSRREDHDVNPGYGTVSELIDALVSLAGTQGGGVTQSIRQNLEVVRDKKWWILLTDNAISGGSARSDVEKLKFLRTFFYPGDAERRPAKESPQILLCAQVVTEQALHEISRALDPTCLFYGIEFDDRFRINSDSCELLVEQSTLREVRELCEWFGDIFFSNNSDIRFDERLKAHRDKGGKANYAYGWRDCGYTIVSQENCFSNSIPLLYYTPTPGAMQVVTNGHHWESPYVPPFPRTESRVTHKTSSDRENLAWLNEPENRQAVMRGFGG